MKWYILLLVVVSGRHVVADCAPGTTVGPCLCMEDTAQNVALECSNVTDGSQITAALEQIQVAFISSMDIRNSPELVSLPDAVFGTTAVGGLRIYNTGLVSISESVFNSPTAESLTTLYVKYNKDFTQLNSAMVRVLTALESLYVSNNALTALTDPLPNTPLQYIDLSRNNIDQIVENYFTNGAELTVVLLGFNSLTSDDFIDANQGFVGNNQDLYFDLGWNSISNGLNGMVFTMSAPRELILSGNGITNLTEDSFSSLMNQMAMQYTTQDPYILMDNNPLLCGCEVAWVVDHPNRPVLQSAQCSNGQLLENLLPGDFAGC